MVLNFVNRYRKMRFEERTIFNTRFSILFNFVMAIAKFIIAIFNGIFFFVSGLVNIFMMIAKGFCYLGEKKMKDEKLFQKYNFLIAIFVMLAGLQYAIYMARLIYTDVAVMEYDMFLGIMVACVSFVELGIAIKGCFNSFGKGHYYRNIKAINLCSALTAMVLTEVALMSFAYTGDSRLMDGLFGLIVGFLIVIIGLFILIAPKFSIVDRTHNVYTSQEESKLENIWISLTKSKFYGNYYYQGKVINNYCDGWIKKMRSPLLKWNIFLKILVIILSEILIFPYAIGYFIYFLKNGTLIKKLDSKMQELGFVKESESEE